MTKNQDEQEIDSFEDLSDEALDQLADDGDDVAYDTGDLGDENWDDQSEQGGKPARKKKKGGASTLIIILVGVLAAGGFVYFKFMSGSAAPVPVTTNAPASPAPVPVDGAAAQPPATAPDVNVAAEAPIVPTNPSSAPEPLTPMPDFAVAAESSPMAAPVIPERSQIASDTEAMPSMPPAVEAEPALPDMPPVPAAPPTMTDVPPMPIAPAPVTAADHKSEPIAPQSSEVTMTESAVAVDASAVSVDLKGIQTQLADLVATIKSQQESIDNLQSVSGAIADLSQRLTKLESVKPIAMDKPNKESPVKDHSLSQDAKTPKNLAPILKTPSQQKAVVAKATNLSAQKWVLRAVSSGVAYISPKGSNELRAVKVGDSIPGFGSVSAISLKGGRWEIITTAGRIAQ